jgi:hypothetical protein
VTTRELTETTTKVDEETLTMSIFITNAPAPPSDSQTDCPVRLIVICLSNREFNQSMDLNCVDAASKQLEISATKIIAGSSELRFGAVSHVDMMESVMFYSQRANAAKSHPTLVQSSLMIARRGALR